MTFALLCVKVIPMIFTTQEDSLMQPMSRKCAHFTDSVIRRMTRIAIANNAINLAQGFPDFDPPKGVLRNYRMGGFLNQTW